MPHFLSLSSPATARAPPLLLLGVHNSLADAGVAGGVCRLTLYAPYWLNNRTGVDLFYQDQASAPGNPFLLGAPLPWEYGEVIAPGTSMTEMVKLRGAAASDFGSFTWAQSSLDGLEEEELAQAVLEYKLVLMNKQDSVRLGLAHAPSRQYGPSIQIKTAGEARAKGKKAWEGRYVKMARTRWQPYPKQEGFSSHAWQRWATSASVQLRRRICRMLLFPFPPCALPASC